MDGVLRVATFDIIFDDVFHYHFVEFIVIRVVSSHWSVLRLGGKVYFGSTLVSLLYSSLPLVARLHSITTPTIAHLLSFLSSLGSCLKPFRCVATCVTCCVL